MIQGSQPREATSLLGRLMSDDAATAAAQGGHRSTRRGLEELVRHDLENLLNTRWRCLSWPPGLDELEQSLVNYGIPDFSGASFGDPASHRELRRILEQCIRRFEPRLRAARVVLLERGGRQDRMLHFKIEAELGVGAELHAVAFETALDPTSARFRVGSSGR